MYLVSTYVAEDLDHARSVASDALVDDEPLLNLLWRVCSMENDSKDEAVFHSLGTALALVFSKLALNRVTEKSTHVVASDALHLLLKPYIPCAKLGSGVDRGGATS